ncbi:MAG TPA: (2Fe-2S)-binding protein, partial [Albitalea sp.]
PFGHERAGLLFRAAAHEPPPLPVLRRIEALLGLDDPAVLAYEDRRRGQRRAMRLVRNGTDTRLDAFLLAGDASGEAWIKTLLQEQLPAQAYGRALLAPGAKAPAAIAPRGRQVCTCFDVSEPRIEQALAGGSGSADQRLARLQQVLKCGTNCGSCIPELKRLVRRASMAA